jgi:hypothetical protein
MNAQLPAEGILINRDYGDAKTYTIPCECCGANCEHKVWIEADSVGVTVTTYTQQKTKWWELNRFQIIWRLLTRGYVEYEASVIMTEQQALNYSTVLISAMADVKEFRKQRLVKK